MRFDTSCGVTARGLILAVLALIGICPAAVAQTRSIVRTVQIGEDGAYLGVEMEDVTADNMGAYKLAGERGVIVKSVLKGSPAEAAGLQEKDVILEYAGMPIFSAAQFSRMVRETPVGRKVDMVVSRESKKVNLSAKVGKREGAPSGRDGVINIMPGDESGRQFEFKVPGPEGFSFQGPRRGWQAFVMPRSGSAEVSGEKPRLGVTLQPLTSQMAEFLGVAGKKGVLVTAVTEGSPASGRIRAGDVIIRVDDKTVSDPEEVIRTVGGKEGKMNLTLVRDKKETTVSVELPSKDSKSSKGGYRM